VGIQIEDGLGSGNRARVASDNHLGVDAVTFSKMAEQSHANGFAFTITSTHVTSAVNREMFYLQNDADEHMHIETVSMASSIINIATVLEVTGGTPAGTTISPTNLNLISGVSKAFTAFGNEDVAALTGNILWSGRVPVHGTVEADFQGALILGTGDGISVSWDLAASVEVTVMGYWLDPTA
jgi:hypothetical protein